MSVDTRCFKEAKYHNYSHSYDIYYNRKTGKVILVESRTQEISSFWTISRMQRLELFNFNHMHKRVSLLDELIPKRVAENMRINNNPNQNP